MQLENVIGISIDGACLGYYSLDDSAEQLRRFKFCAELVSGKDYGTQVITKEVNGKSYVFYNLIESHD